MLDLNSEEDLVARLVVLEGIDVKALYVRNVYLSADREDMGGLLGLVVSVLVGGVVRKRDCTDLVRM